MVRPDTISALPALKTSGAPALDVARPAVSVPVRPDAPVTVAWVANILDPVASRQIMTAAAGSTLGQALQRFVPLAPAGFEIVACLNGTLLSVPRHDLILLPGDSLVMAARPLGGGGGGSNPLAAVAMIAVMVVASVVSFGVSSAVMGSWAWGFGMAANATGMAMIAGGAAGIAAMAVGGYLVSSAFKAKLPDFGGLGGADMLGNSPSYSWEVQPNPLAEGTTLPVLYGKFLVAAPLIARFVESAGTQQHLNLLYALAAHRIDAVENVLINDQPMSTYRDTVLDVRMGDVDQTPVPFFGDLKEEVSISAKLSTEWTQRLLPGTMQGFAVGIGYRLYYANDGGGMDWVTANLYLECRKKGASTWTRYTRKNTSPVTTTQRRWSAGYYSSGGGYTVINGRRRSRWVEIQAGSTNRNEHYSGEEFIVEEHHHKPWQRWCDFDGTCTRKVYEWRWLEFETVYQPGEITYDFLPISGNDTAEHRYVLFLDHIPEGEYEIRMRLVSPLAESARHGSDVWWEFAQLIQYDDFSYPTTALVGVRALATDQISSSQPTVKFLIRRDTVYVYNPDARRYEQRAANNPAWACYDALHNGADGHPDPSCYGLAVPWSRIVYADFADWAAWCDTKGYTVNAYVESPLTGKATLDLLGLMGRGSVIQVGSRFTCSVDRPVDLPRQTFLVGLGNIAAKTFKKSYLPLQDRANVIELTYFDAEANYQRQTVEIYQDGFDSAKRNVVKTSRTLHACTSRQQALCFGRGLMLRNRYLTYMPSFETGVEAIHCLQGDVIELADDTLNGGYSGRFVAADAYSATLDCSVTMYPGVPYALEVQHIDTDEREYAYVVGVPVETETDTVTLLEPWKVVPGVGSKYSFGEVGRTKRPFRVVNMQTAQDQRKRLQLLEYVPEVYNDEVYEPPAEDWGQRAFVRNLRLVEIWQAGGPDGSGQSVIGVSWRGNALSWNVWVRQQGGTWNKAGASVVPEYRIASGLVIGTTYDVAVSIGTPENGVAASLTLRGKTAPPGDVTGFRAVALGDEIVLTWNHIPDADLWGYEIRMGKTWDTGLTVVEGVQENRAAWVPPMDGTYRFWIKALDLCGIYSANAAEAAVSIDISGVLNVVWQKEELPDAVPAATLDRMASLDGGEAVSWIPSMTDADFPPWFTDASIAYYCGDTAPGVYLSQVYDLGTVTPFNIRLFADFDAVLVGATDLTYPGRVDTDYPSDTDTRITSLSRYTAEYRLSAAAWSEWQAWTGPHDVTGRYMQFRFTTDLDSVGVKFRFERLASMADVPEQSTVFKASLPADGGRFTMQDIGLRPMLLLFHVGVTVLGNAALFPAVEQEAQAFTVRAFDVMGNPHAADVSIEVRGF